MSRSILSSGIKSLQIRPVIPSLLHAPRQFLGTRPAISAIAAFHSPASRNASRNENKPSLSNFDFLHPPSKRSSASASGAAKQGLSGKKPGRAFVNKDPAGSGGGGDPFDVLDGSQPTKDQPSRRDAKKSAPVKAVPPLDRPPRDEEIQAQWIQFINEEGQNEGEKLLKQVLRSIDRKKFFLIQVDTHSNPPICKLFSKSELFQKAKKEKQAKKANEVVTKELQLQWGTSEHDLAHKLNKFKGFLLKGYRVDIHITGRKGKSSTKEDREALLEKIKAELEPDSKYVRHLSWSNEVTANMLLQGNKKP